MKSLGVILASFLIKLHEVASSVWGWVITILLAIGNFFVDYRLAFYGVLVCVVFDAVAGIWAAIKQGKYARSELMRDTFSKIFAYGGALIIVVFIEEMVGKEGVNIGTNIIGACICATELWSIGANMLIVNPNLKFFKLFKTALVGEIARKLKLTEDDVKDALNDGKNLIETMKEKEDK